jgi:hypothetical protein
MQISPLNEEQSSSRFWDTDKIVNIQFIIGRKFSYQTTYAPNISLSGIYLLGKSTYP